MSNRLRHASGNFGGVVPWPGDRLGNRRVLNVYRVPLASDDGSVTSPGSRGHEEKALV